MTDLDLPDVNVVVALLNPGHVFHSIALQWFISTSQFSTTPITEAGFIRVSLNPALSGTALQLSDILASLASLRSDKRWIFLLDDSSLIDPAVDLVGLVGHKQATDFHLVNLAAKHDAKLITLDSKISGSLTPTDQQYIMSLLR